MKKTDMCTLVLDNNKYELCSIEIKWLKLKVTELSEEINQLKQQLNKYEASEEKTIEKSKDKVKNLELENKQLKEELANCTRKHWQTKCGEHYINELLLKSRIDKAIEYINEHWGSWCFNHYEYATTTIKILKGEDK